MTHQNMVTKRLDVANKATLYTHLCSRQIGKYINSIFDADGNKGNIPSI